MSQKYLALTIGPIYKTISQARHTRELWAASYTFSYLMKQICKGIPNKSMVIIPALTEDLFDNADLELLKTGVGLFPDRLIMKTEESFSFDNFNALIDHVLADFALKVAQHLKKTKQYDSILNAFKSYFQLYTLEIEIQGNAIESIMPYLDSMELQRSYSLQDNNILRSFFYRVSRSFLIQDAFGTSSKSFDSLVNIATKHFENDRELPKLPEPKELEEGDDIEINELEQKDQQQIQSYSDTLDQRIIELARQFNPHDSRTAKPFLPCYKYVAVVQADGDNVGTIVKNLANQSEDKLITFSQKLYHFSKSAVKLIDQYGGMNIYAGGDDLLFFAPVRCGNSNIFILLKLLDELFQTTLSDYSTSLSKPSLSFGLSIAHFKAPLYETIKDVSYRLFGVAKSHPKNSLAFQIEKHSGQQFSSKVLLNSGSYKMLLEMLELKLDSEQIDLRGLIYNLKRKELELMATLGIDTRIDNFFNNNFNETIHQREGRRFLDKVREMLKANILETQSLQQAIINTFMLLKIYSFMTSKELK